MNSSIVSWIIHFQIHSVSELLYHKLCHSNKTFVQNPLIPKLNLHNTAIQLFSFSQNVLLGDTINCHNINMFCVYIHTYIYIYIYIYIIRIVYKVVVLSVKKDWCNFNKARFHVEVLLWFQKISMLGSRYNKNITL